MWSISHPLMEQISDGWTWVKSFTKFLLTKLSWDWIIRQTVQTYHCHIKSWLGAHKDRMGNGNSQGKSFSLLQGPSRMEDKCKFRIHFLLSWTYFIFHILQQKKGLRLWELPYSSFATRTNAIVSVEDHLIMWLYLEVTTGGLCRQNGNSNH